MHFRYRDGTFVEALAFLTEAVRGYALNVQEESNTPQCAPSDNMPPIVRNYRAFVNPSPLMLT